MRKICFYSGARSDYGHIRPVLQAIRDHPRLRLQVLASGGHLVAEQGSTIRELEADGIPVDETVEMVVASDTATGAAKSFGLGVIGYADALARLKPDILLLVGDRYETLAAAVTATFRRLAIAHLGGGEVTAGSTDDAARHAISKMAHLHFAATEVARRRVIQLGEPPSMVHTTGSPAIDLIVGSPAMDRAAVCAALGQDIGHTTVLVTYHPATADPEGSVAGARGLLAALDRFPEATVIFTGTNLDHGRSVVAELIDAYVSENPHRCSVFSSLGQQLYVNLLRHASVVVGNSSSGICEAPAVQTPTVNIGSRQHGRPRVKSVVDTTEGQDDIALGIGRALSSEHQLVTAKVTSPYGDGHATGRIVDLIEALDLDEALVKNFHNVLIPEGT